MANETVDAIERNIKAAKSIVEFGNSIERLRGNKEFKSVVVDGYFEREAIRLVHLKADQNMQSPESQRSILSQMDAIGAFNQYLTIGLQQAALAAKSIVADEDIRDEILAEEVAE